MASTNDMQALVSVYEQASKENQSLVLATLVDTEGSTYRKTGAMMLITVDQQFHGLLSGGCLEGDIIAHAKEVFDTGNSKTIYYDHQTSEDLVWGLGLGCNGAVRIFLQLLTPEDSYDPFETLAINFQNQDISYYEMVIHSDETPELIGKLDIRSSSTPLSHFGIDIQDVVRMGDELADFLEASKPVLIHFGEDGKNEVQILYSRVLPPPQLLLLGGGPDATPITRLAKEIGWDVSVVDHRPAYATKERFPEADRVIHSHPHQLLENKDLQSILERRVAVVIMSHHFDSDQKYLKELAKKEAAYIGLLGPKSRKDELLKEFTLEEISHLEERLFSPAGLDLGGELPESIALSILAEAHAVLHNASGTSLRNSNEPIHK